MEILKCENLTFSYPKMREESEIISVLKNIDFTVNKGELVLIVGPSGCGKTTLIKHMKKNMIPVGTRSGNVYFNGSSIGHMDDRESAKRIGYVGQDPDNQIVTDKVWHEIAFGLENLGLNNIEIRKKSAEMAQYFGITDWYDKDTNELSGGQKQLLNIASVMVMQPDVILLDEPTAQLDPIAADRLMEVIMQLNKEIGVTVIMTEHRLEKLYSNADKIVVMDDGRMLCCCPPSDAAKVIIKELDGIAQGLPAAMQIYEQVQDIVSKSHKCPLTVSEGRLWINELLDLVNVDKLKAINNEVGLKSGYGKEKAQKELTAISAKDVFYRYGRGEAFVLKGVSMSVQKRSVTAFLGGNGAGKSTLLKIFSGLIKPQKGKVTVADKVIMLPQNPQALFTEISVEEELADALMDISNGSVSGKSMDEKRKIVDRYLQIMNLECVRKNNPYDLSGGQQQKLAIAKVLMYNPEILILDEPTKGIDPGFKKDLGKMFRDLSNSGKTIIISSHDVDFCAEFSDECALLFDGVIVAMDNSKRFFAGNRFYTTQVSRMISQHFPLCVTCEDAAYAIKRALTEE